ASCYHPSPRPLPARLPPLDYPGHMEVRRVSTCGTISWNSAPLFVATALAGEYVAFEEIDDGLWTRQFATIALARYDERHRTLHPIPIAVNGGGPPHRAWSRPLPYNGQRSSYKTTTYLLSTG